VNITQKTIIQLEAVEVRDAMLSIPCRERLADTNSAASEGFVRHGGVTKAIDRSPKECKVPYQDHLKQYLTKSGDPLGLIPRPIIAFGSRNSIQNLWLPIYDATGEPQAVFRRDEPLGETIYQGFCAFRDKRKLHFSIERLRFETSNGRSAIELLDSNPAFRGTLEFVITGQPILFNSEVTPHHMIAAVTYDQRQAWHLEWEDWQHNDRDRQTHNLLMQTMMSKLHSSVRERAAALVQIAADAGVGVEDGYLHSSLSTSCDGKMINIAMMHGSFEEIARAHLRLGAHRAILLDNGGSVGLAAWLRRAWLDLQSAGRPVPPEPTFIGNNTYFRPRAHAVVLMELEKDIVERAFHGRERGDIAW
jgi:hypothetical protein